MSARQQSWPEMWLMTDERMGERLWEALHRLPLGRGGVVLRHYSLSTEARRQLAVEVVAVCRARELAVAIGRDVDLAQAVAADLTHNPHGSVGILPFSRSVHTEAEAEMARRDGANLVFISPVFETRSHPGQRALGIAAASALAKIAGMPALGLGGVNARNFAELRQAGFHGWAGIDAWLTPDQNLNAVPT